MSRENRSVRQSVASPLNNIRKSKRALGKFSSGRKSAVFLSAVAAGAALAASSNSAIAAPVTGFNGGSESTAYFGSTVTTVTLLATNTAAQNLTAIQNAINTTANATVGNGGTVVINGTGIFNVAGTINLASNLNVQLNTEIKESTANATIMASSGTLQNIALTTAGGGIIDGGATTVAGGSGTKLVNLQGITNLLVKGVTVQDAPLEHLVTEKDTNVTIDGININDNGVLTAHGGYLGSTDGIDYNGTNFLIENNTIKDGDDDIVVKTTATGSHDILVQNNIIYAGHGISAGGGIGGGITNYTVNNDTFIGGTVTNGVTNTITIGLRIKADDQTSGDQGGGTAGAASALYENITMSNVTTPIELDSFYNGGENLPTSPRSGDLPGASSGSTNSSSPNVNEKHQYPAGGVGIDATTPVYSNIIFANITDNSSTLNNSNSGIIVGENSTPFNITGLTFDNVTINSKGDMEIWYTGGLKLYGLTINGTAAPNFVTGSPALNATQMAEALEEQGFIPAGFPDISFWGDQILITVPEPTSLALALPILGGIVASRQFGRRRSQAISLV